MDVVIVKQDANVLLSGSELPKVFCVIPTHNRLDCIREIVDQLRAQTYPSIAMVVVDDGSTDGTASYLRSLGDTDCVVLQGDGELWWGGAMALGMAYALEKALDQDYILMLNDDVAIERQFVEVMVNASRQYNDAVVGATQRELGTNRIMSRGYTINFRWMRIGKIDKGGDPAWPDTLPGRGAIIRVDCVRKAGVVDGHRFPHYLSDIEYFWRVKESGVPIVVLKAISVSTSGKSSDHDVRKRGLLARYIGRRSKDSIWPRIRFFLRHGPIWYRLTALPRFLVISLIRGTAKKRDI